MEKILQLPHVNSVAVEYVELAKIIDFLYSFITDLLIVFWWGHTLIKIG